MTKECDFYINFNEEGLSDEDLHKRWKKDSQEYGRQLYKGMRKEARAGCFSTLMKILITQTFFVEIDIKVALFRHCLLYTSPSPRDRTRSRMPSSA